MNPAHYELIAHRGASGEAPENTLAAVKLAWEQGADAVEIDVRLSADGRIFAMHDNTPARYGGPETIAEQMTWSELSQLDVGRWKAEKYAGERVPLLEQILPLTPPGKRLFIEIKSGPEIVPHLQQVLQGSQQTPAKYCVIAFSEQVAAAVREQLPFVAVYWLVAVKQEGNETRPTAAAIIKKARQLDVPGVDLGGDLTEATIREIREAGLSCYAWTINEPDKARQLANWGVQGITTDWVKRLQG